jgi:hypothetical protein
VLAVSRPPGAYVTLHFIETTWFTQRVQDLGLESAIRSLQAELRADPVRGDLDAGTGGLRKIRIPDPSRGKGKRSGARVHYLYLQESAVVYLLFVYSKDERATLNSVQKRRLKDIVDAIRAEWRTRSR